MPRDVSHPIYDAAHLSFVFRFRPQSFLPLNVASFLASRTHPRTHARTQVFVGMVLNAFQTKFEEEREQVAQEQQEKLQQQRRLRELRAVEDERQATGGQE